MKTDRREVYPLGGCGGAGSFPAKAEVPASY